MTKREWLSSEHKIFRQSSGAVYARISLPGLGRKEFPIGKQCADPLPLDAKLLKSLIAAKDRKVAEILREHEPKPASLYRFEELALEIIASKKEKAFKTWESADIHLGKHLIPFCSERHPYLYEWEEKGETLWQEYIDLKRGESPRMKFMNHRKHLGMVLLRAFERGIIKRRVKLYSPDPEIDVGQVLTHEEVKAVYSAASPTLKTQIIMAFTMGLRKSEILRLDWIRVDFERDELIFHRKNTKTRKPRHVPMNAYVKRALEARHVDRKGPFVFGSRYNPANYQRSNKTAWGAAKRRAGITARFHDLRHTFITNAIRAGMNPILVCKYAGLSQEVMASVYCHLDTKDLKQLATGHGVNMGEVLQ